MVANILPTDTPLTLGWGQKVKPYLFLKVVILLIKLKVIEHRAPWKQMLPLHTPSTPGVGSKGLVVFFFSESGHVAYQA